MTVKLRARLPTNADVLVTTLKTPAPTSVCVLLLQAVRSSRPFPKRKRVLVRQEQHEDLRLQHPEQLTVPQGDPHSQQVALYAGLAVLSPLRITPALQLTPLIPIRLRERVIT